MKRRILLNFLLLLCCTTACQFRPLEEVSNTHYVRVYLNENLLNLTEGFYNEEYQRPSYHTPQVMHVALANPSTGVVVAERYLRNQGDDAYGHYFDGYIICDPGEWDFLVWNFDTETTQVGKERNVFEAYGYTNDIASHLRAAVPDKKGPSDAETPARVVYDPDPLFVVQSRVDLPYTDRIDTLKAPDGGRFVAECITETWFLQVRVKGMDYVNSAVSMLTGMAGSKWLWNPRMNEADPVTLYFEMTEGPVNITERTSLVYATFSTFGRLPGVTNDLHVTFHFFTTYGTTYTETLDISLKFDEEDAINHQWLLLDKDTLIEIPEPSKGGGGFSPGVGNWDDVESDLII